MPNTGWSDALVMYGLQAGYGKPCVQRAVTESNPGMAVLVMDSRGAFAVDCSHSCVSKTKRPRKTPRVSVASPT